MRDPPFVSGSVPFTINGETFKTCYRTVGDIKARRPLVLLHGGPGVPSNSLEPFAQLADFGTPVILYDQFGCGESLPTDPNDVQRFENLTKDDNFWTPSVFVQELENLLQHLGIAEDFDLFGHSWGGMLANQYIIERQPKGLKHLILANSTPGIPNRIKTARVLIETDDFPRNYRNIIKFAEDHSDLEQKLTRDELEALRQQGINLKSPEYREATMEFQKRFVLRVQPWPASLMAALAARAKSPVGNIMWGPAATNPNGTLKDWSIIDQLHKIDVPTLVYSGKHEQAWEYVVEPVVSRIPKCKYVEFENSSHMPQYEEPERCMEVVKDFLLGAH